MWWQWDFNGNSTKFQPRKNTVIQLTHVKPYLKNDAATWRASGLWTWFARSATAFAPVVIITLSNSMYSNDLLDQFNIMVCKSNDLRINTYICMYNICIYIYLKVGKSFFSSMTQLHQLNPIDHDRSDLQGSSAGWKTCHYDDDHHCCFMWCLVWILCDMFYVYVIWWWGWRRWWSQWMVNRF